jgi:hypothetical protein
MPEHHSSGLLNGLMGNHDFYADWDVVPCSPAHVLSKKYSAATFNNGICAFV